MEKLSATKIAENYKNLNSGKTFKVQVFTEIDSTNLYAKKILTESKLKNDYEKFHGCIFVAEKQTQGKGRQGRSFYSPENAGIYMSMIYIYKEGIVNPALITASSAVGVCRCLKKNFEINPKIKWVNDLFLNNKKICGILTEGIINQTTSCIDAVVVGIGINLIKAAKDFPSELKNIAGTIINSDLAPNKDIDRNKLIAEIASSVFYCINESLKGNQQIITEYQQNTIFTPGMKLQVFPFAGNSENQYEAFFDKIDENANLIVKLADGNKKILYSGEVSLKSSTITN